jgi:glycine cleavage system H lipoate-binding protein
MKIFPNPVSGYVNIESKKEISDIQVINYYGEVVYRNNEINRNTFLLETYSFATGNYLVRIITIDGKSIS